MEPSHIAFTRAFLSTLRRLSEASVGKPWGEEERKLLVANVRAEANRLAHHFAVFTDVEEAVVEFALSVATVNGEPLRDPVESAPPSTLS